MECLHTRIKENRWYNKGLHLKKKNLRSEQRHCHNDRRTGCWPDQQDQNEGEKNRNVLYEQCEPATSYVDVHWNVMLQGQNSTCALKETSRLKAGVCVLRWPPSLDTTPAPFHGAPTRSLDISVGGGWGISWLQRCHSIMIEKNPAESQQGIIVEQVVVHELPKGWLTPTK